MNRAGKLLYQNGIAKDLLDAMQRKDPSSSGNGAAAPSALNRQESDSRHLIRQLHLYFQKTNAYGARSVRNGIPVVHPVFLKRHWICFGRTFRLQSRPETPEGASLLILIEAFLSDQGPIFQSPQMTEREQDVVRLLFDGKTSNEAAVSMGISERPLEADHEKTSSYSSSRDCSFGSAMSQSPPLDPVD